MPLLGLPLVRGCERRSFKSAKEAEFVETRRRRRGERNRKLIVGASFAYSELIDASGIDCPGFSDCPSTIAYGVQCRKRITWKLNGQITVRVVYGCQISEIEPDEKL